jgi:hypothetical protein
MKRDFILALLSIIAVIVCFGLIGADDCKTQAATKEYEAKIIKQARDRHERERRDDQAYKWFFNGGK